MTWFRLCCIERFPYNTGVFNALVTTPLWVVNTRLKVQSKSEDRERQQNTSGPKKQQALSSSAADLARDEEEKAKYNGLIGKYEENFIYFLNTCFFYKHH